MYVSQLNFNRTIRGALAKPGSSLYFVSLRMTGNCVVLDYIVHMLSGKYFLWIFKEKVYLVSS
jgi:hypothetical protein